MTGPVPTTERDTTLFSHQIANVVHEERHREIERRLRFRHEAPEVPKQVSLRKRLGLGLIRLGSSLASDGPLQLAARR
jgi:hypothetical protein